MPLLLTDDEDSSDNSARYIYYLLHWTKTKWILRYKLGSIYLESKPLKSLGFEILQSWIWILHCTSGWVIVGKLLHLFKLQFSHSWSGDNKNTCEQHYAYPTWWLFLHPSFFLANKAHVQSTKAENSRYRHRSEIVRVWFQTTALKRASQLREL